MWIPILISVEIRSYDSLSINKSKAAILAINRYVKGLLVLPEAKNTKYRDSNAQPAGKEHKGFLKRNECTGIGTQILKPTRAQGLVRTKQSVANLFAKQKKHVTGSKSNSNELVTKNGVCTREKHFSFPTKRKMFTVLRSPHIDKKSREHFQWRQSKMTVFLEFKKPGEWDLFLFILENARLPGVQLLVGCQYSTFCAF